MKPDFINAFTLVILSFGLSSDSRSLYHPYNSNGLVCKWKDAKYVLSIVILNVRQR